MAWKWSSRNSNYWIYESKWFIWAFAPAKVVINQSIGVFKWFDRLLKHHTNMCHTSEYFPAFQTSLKLGFLYKSAVLCDVRVRFFCFDFCKCNSTLCQFYWISDLHIEIDLFCGDEHRKQNNADSRVLLTRWRCLLNRGIPSLSTCGNTLYTYFLNLLPERLCFVVLKQGKMLNILLRFKFQLLEIFILCFAICWWKFSCSR